MLDRQFGNQLCNHSLQEIKQGLLYGWAACLTSVTCQGPIFRDIIGRCFLPSQHIYPRSHIVSCFLSFSAGTSETTHFR